MLISHLLTGVDPQLQNLQICVKKNNNALVKQFLTQFLWSERLCLGVYIRRKAGMEDEECGGDNQRIKMGDSSNQPQRHK